MRGWNRCDHCGRFAKPEEMEFGETPNMTWGGYVWVDYWQHHKEGFGCRVKVKV